MRREQIRFQNLAKGGRKVGFTSSYEVREFQEKDFESEDDRKDELGDNEVKSLLIEIKTEYWKRCTGRNSNKIRWN